MTHTLPLFGVLLCLPACAAPASAIGLDDDSAGAHSPVAGLTVSTGAFVLHGATVLTPTGAVIEDVVVRGGRIVRLGASGPGDGPFLDVTGRFVAPAFIDSHVHLAYLPEGATLADHGIAGAVDMAAPESFLTASHAPLEVLASGPMVTAVHGYPTESWGSNGYGIECADSAAAVAAVDRLVGEGAKLIKLPITGPAGQDQLDDSAVAAAAAEAHARGVLTASHALGDDEAARAAADGIDVLAHTPTGTLSTATVSAWASRTVVTTLVAFGNSATTRENLTALRSAGARVLYGTDFGNAQDAAINAEEVQGMLDAGMTGQAIVDAGTTVPAAFWGFSDLGTLQVGKKASLLILNADPRLDPLTLAQPVAVYIDGRRR